MNTEIWGIIATFILTILLGIPLGRYMAKVFKGEKVWSDFFTPLERFFFKVSGIDPNKPMDWKENLKAMLLLNLVFFLWVFLLLMVTHPFLNPNNIPGMESSLAFNTAISFVTNTNLQHYSGETQASYFTQISLLMFMMFVSGATGIAAVALLFKGLVQRQSSDIGNFYNLVVKSTTRILLPVVTVTAVILLLNGIPMTFSANPKIVTLQGDTVSVATGPVAGIIAIKQAGTNGGGYFGTNSAHPLENPNYFTNMVENYSLLVIAVGIVFALGFYIQKKKMGYIFAAVMAAFMISFIAFAVHWEVQGNPEIRAMGISPSQASNMEGKEMRIGAAASAYWGVTTTSTSCGAVNSMHDSFMPLSGGLFMADMMINSIFGGVGVGFLNFFIYLVVAVFIAGLMVGRTPELLGKKIEAKEVKIAAIVLLIHPLLILTGTAIAAHVSAINPSIGWTPNPGYHGFSEMLYEFASSAANNGSGFEGLGDNTYFWNILTGVVMLLARFIPIVGPVAIGGLLAKKKIIPESSGTLRIDTPTFGIVLISVIIIVSALSFFPALAVGPIAEYFSM